MGEFFAVYGSFIKLAIVFAAIIVVLRFKKPLSIAILVGAVLTVILYGIPLMDTLSVVQKAIYDFNLSVLDNKTFTVIASCYVITFLQRMMEQKGDLKKAQKAMSRIFNNRRINASLTPVIIGLLPSPGAIFIAGSMVDDAVGDSLSQEDKTFVTSFFRHIPESFLPTYSSIILACQLTGIDSGSFVMGMLPMVVALYVIGYALFLRKVPKDTGEPASESKTADLKDLFVSLWPIIFVIFGLVVFPRLPGIATASWKPMINVYTVTFIAIVGYFITGKFKFSDITPYFISAWEWRIVTNVLVVMPFSALLGYTNVITELPTLFAKLPIPTFLVFGLLFILGTIVAGSTAIISMCLMMAFEAIPGAGLPLMVFLMSCTYVAMQVSPTHVCLTLASEYFKTDFGALIKRTIPVLGIFFVVLIAYYQLMLLVF